MLGGFYEKRFGVLERSAELTPDKTAFTDEAAGLSYAQAVSAAKAIGTALCELKTGNRPVAVFSIKASKA